MPIYTATFCLMKENLGANCLGHAFVALTRFDVNEENQLVSTVQLSGFLGVPSGHPDSLKRKLKKNIVRMDIDFIGNHGVWMDEEWHYYDRGEPLYGRTFLLTEAQYLALSEKDKKLKDEWKNAIDEAVEDLNISTDKQNKFKIYEYERYSKQLHAREKEKSEAEGRPARLHDFDMNVFGPSPNTCKMEAVSFLASVLTLEQAQSLEGLHIAVPRLSGKNFDPVYFYSHGDFDVHTKASGEVIKTRKNNSNNATLSWAIPPQIVELPDGTIQPFAINVDLEKVRTVVSRLIKLEWLFINAKIDKKHSQRRDKLIYFIGDLYKRFSIVDYDKSRARVLNHFFSPRSIHLESIQQANRLFDTLCDTIINQHDNDASMLAGLAAHLSEKDQIKLCEILDRKEILKKRSCCQCAIL
ncbi:MAG: hypothetical protein SFW66_06050 [Gammaproteobacteria bacterium]|nr:hypothetical protein [Gammaproteobacteria bacterium]